MAGSTYRIAILGCGSAGPAAALLLARSGHTVDLFERAPALGPVGTGFMLQPTGLAVLEKLGLRDEAEAFGAPLDGLTTRTRENRTLLDLRYAALGSGEHAYGMHRASLLDLLVRDLPKAGVKLHLGCELRTCRTKGILRYVASEDTEFGPYDLIVVANGARSSARLWTGQPARVRPYAWGALWAILPDPERIFPNRLQQVVDGTDTMVGFLPSGFRSDDPDKTPLVSLFWSLRRDAEADTRGQGAKALKENILRLEPRAEALFSAGPPHANTDDTRNNNDNHNANANAIPNPNADIADEMDAWSFAEYRDVSMQQWHGPGFVALGDAAHAMSPQLGQGVNLALVDAEQLAECVALPIPLDRALMLYSLRRKRHLRFYQLITRALTPFFQSDFARAGELRDWALPLLSRLPFFERQMISTMAGEKDGLLSVRRSNFSADRTTPLDDREDIR